MVYANIPNLCGTYAYGNTFDFKTTITGAVDPYNHSGFIYGSEGTGIAKWGIHTKEPPLDDLINGLIPMTNYSPDKVKRRLFQKGYLREECYICGFHERRVTDYKVPLLLHFKDKNKIPRQNLRL